MATATEKQGKVRTYYSKSPTFQIIRERADERLGPNNKIFVANMKSYESNIVRFKDGWLRVREGEQVLPNPETGEPEDLVTFLERQLSFGNMFHRQDDIKPAPSTDELTRIGELIAAGDRQGLAEVYKAEIEGDERPEILRMIEAVVKGDGEPETA